MRKLNRRKHSNLSPILDYRKDEPASRSWGETVAVAIAGVEACLTLMLVYTAAHWVSTAVHLVVTIAGLALVIVGICLLVRAVVASEAVALPLLEGVGLVLVGTLMLCVPYRMGWVK